MCRIGLIDDVKEEYENYKYKLELRNIELLYMDYQSSFDEIFNWIRDNRIEVLLIDYKLEQLYEFNGSKLFQMINNVIPDLQCILFTSNPEEDDDLVMKSLKLDKSIINTDSGFNTFVDLLNQASRVFNKRQNETINEYKNLLEKKKKSDISPLEEKRFIELYKILISYGVIENVPEKLLESDFEKAIDDLINDVENYIKKEGENE